MVAIFRAGHVDQSVIRRMQAGSLLTKMADVNSVYLIITAVFDAMSNLKLKQLERSKRNVDACNSLEFCL